MASRKRPRKAHWLNNQLWLFALGEWIALTLGFLGVVVVFCLFFIRRHVIDYRFDHTFAVNSPEFIGSALSFGNPILVTGNKIDILENGDAYFPAMLDAIEHARATVNFEAFILYSDEVGRRFRDAFCRRAQSGVEVRILLDGIGSSWSLNNSDVRQMREAGCKFSYYHPTHSWRIDRTNRRSHRRILTIDGRVAFTGGAGFAKEWAGHAQDKDHWRDAQMRIEGPLVAVVQGAFEAHWVKTFGEALSGAGQFPALSSAGDISSQLVLSSSFSMAPVPLVQATAFTAAEKRIWITNAYCTPTPDQVQQLVKAVGRGVDVRLILPGPNNDQPLTKSAGRAAYGDLLKGGVRIFEYQPTMIHEKSLVADGLFVMFGSSNFDARSSEINEELDVVVYNAEFGRKMERRFEENLAHCRAYTLDEFERRSLMERAVEWTMLPFRSQL